MTDDNVVDFPEPVGLDPELDDAYLAELMEALEPSRSKIQVLLSLNDEEKPVAYIADNYAVSEGYFVVESDGVLVFLPTSRIKEVFVRPVNEETGETSGPESAGA